jgi:hypothetical protein
MAAGADAARRLGMLSPRFWRYGGGGGILPYAFIETARVGTRWFASTANLLKTFTVADWKQ